MPFEVLSFAPSKLSKSVIAYFKMQRNERSFGWLKLCHASTCPAFHDVYLNESANVELGGSFGLPSLDSTGFLNNFEPTKCRLGTKHTTMVSKVRKTVDARVSLSGGVIHDILATYKVEASIYHETSFLNSPISLRHLSWFGLAEFKRKNRWTSSFRDPKF